MNIDKKALKSIVDEIEASRLRQKAETEHQREVMKRAKTHQLDTKAVRIVLQRRAMDASKRDEQDYYVHAYELALGGKKLAAEALENGATVREAAAAGGISTGAAGNLAKAVQKQPFVDSGELNPETAPQGIDASLPSAPSGDASTSTQPIPDGGVGVGTNSRACGSEEAHTASTSGEGRLVERAGTTGVASGPQEPDTTLPAFLDRRPKQDAEASVSPERSEAVHA